MAFMGHAVPPEGPSSNLSRSTNHLQWPQVDWLDSRRQVAIELTVALPPKSRFSEAVSICVLSYGFWSFDATCWLCLCDCDIIFLKQITLKKSTFLSWHPWDLGLPRHHRRIRTVRCLVGLQNRSQAINRFKNGHSLHCDQYCDMKMTSQQYFFSRTILFNEVPNLC